MRKQTLTALALTYPEAAPIFQAHGLDYCCHGDVTLAEACARRGLDADAIAAEVERAIGTHACDAAAAPPRALDAVALVDYIREQHDLHLRAAIPFVPSLAARVAREYRARDPRLDEVRDTTVALRRLLERHLDAEEDELFAALADGRTPDPDEILAIRHEHRDIGAALDGLRTLTDGYHAPAWAGPCYRTLIERLQALETHLMTDVHLEDHVLFVRSMRSTMEHGA